MAGAATPGVLDSEPSELFPAANVIGEELFEFVPGSGPDIPKEGWEEDPLLSVSDRKVPTRKNRTADNLSSRDKFRPTTKVTTTVPLCARTDSHPFARHDNG